MAYDNLPSTLTDQFQGISPITREIFLKLKSLSKDDFKTLYKASDSVVEDAIEKLNTEEAFKAIELFNGAVFKNLDYPSLNNDERTYIDKTVEIFSAMYGLIPASSNIRPYRLDLNNSLKPHITSLTSQWKEPINKHLNDCQNSIIIDLASTEYRKLIDYKTLCHPIYSVDFKDLKDGKYKTIGTYAKMARGQFLRAMAKGQVNDLDTLKEISVMDYTFNEELSTGQVIIFSRTE